MTPTSATPVSADIVRDLHSKRSELMRLAAMYGASEVRVFGSVARGDAKDSSDIDLLVTMESGRSLFDLAALQRTFTEVLGRHVDVVSSAGLSPYLRERILSEAQPL